MRYLQVAYALACTIWTIYVIQIIAAAHRTHPEGTLSGAVFCVVLLAMLPAVVGYRLLFKTFPWIGRLSRR